jgi:hypothetical protein
MTAPDLISLGGGWVLVRGLALADASRAVSYVVKQGRRDGVRAPRLTRLEVALRTETAAANGHANAPTDAAVLPFVQDLMTSKEVAHIMQLSERQIRRKAAELGGRKRGHDWLFDPVIVHTAATPERETSD